MKRLLQVLGIVVVGLALLVGVALLSGRQAPLDSVAIAEKRHDIELESSLVPVNGIQLHVVQAGPKDGKPVILLHGYPEFWFAWSAQIARLARAGFRVIAPDQRGYNGSDKPAAVEAYGMPTLVQDIVELTRQLGYEQVYLAGHDWGGAIAWYLALEHPERFTRLVIFNASHPLAWGDSRRANPDEETTGWYRTFFQLPWVPEIVGRLGNWRMLTGSLRSSSREGAFSDEDLDVYRYAWDRDGSMHAMIQWYRAGFRQPYLPQGDGKVKVPTRIIWGMQDKFFAPSMADYSLKYCEDGALRKLPDATHWLLHEEPKLTSDEMIEFFSAEPR